MLHYNPLYFSSSLCALSFLASFVSLFCQSFVVGLTAFVIDTAFQTVFDIDQQKLKSHKETDVRKDS